MREEAFRSYVAVRLSPNSVASYLSNLRATEDCLHIDLDVAPLSDADIAAMRRALRNGGMNVARAGDCGSALKQYAAFRDGANGVSTDQQATRRTISVDVYPAPPRPALIAEASVAELMQLYADLLAELRARGVTRTANGPVGDYAELLFHHAYGWKLKGNSASHYDATDDNGTRYQIKGRRMGGAGSRQLGILRRLPEAHFDVLAAVLFDRDMQVLRAALIPHHIVAERARYVAPTNGWRFILDDSIWSLPTVGDATGPLRDAAQEI